MSRRLLPEKRAEAERLLLLREQVFSLKRIAAKAGCSRETVRKLRLQMIELGKMPTSAR